MERRQFLRSGSVTALGLAAGAQVAGCNREKRDQASERDPHKARAPVHRGVPAKKGSRIVVSTWRHGLAANEAAADRLRGGSALDAVEAGVRVSESDPAVTSVGKGGYPNWEGVVQLDACIMDGPSARAGAVAALEEIENPISVARKVMEETRHVLLVGPGAQRFALEQGFHRTKLLTEAAKEAWTKERARSAPHPSEQGHDTIGMCALDAEGRLAVACTTSGLAWKLPGRVGDSPIIGAGAFVDQDIGAAVATGVGEEVLQTCGSFVVVENMRRGMSPAVACQDAVGRILRKHPEARGLQVAYLALRADGAVGASSIKAGFTYAHHDGGKNESVAVEPWQAR
ncbi:MAG: N(4)-(beta-N-acetylglucosaminyl)-L-asparaginase [Proteobacteria bacterium]|nr:N(4)-(beta-N-acetylglucosaminyl)-L-asparaginase [Pseudomonadota bacterium]